MCGICTLAVIVGMESLGRMLRPSVSADEGAPKAAVVVREPDPKLAPDFRVGDIAPDFTLPDSKDVEHRLSALVRRETLLCFTCGCAKCLDVQTYLGILMKRAGAKAGPVISVSTMPKAREASYRRDTKLRQTILYESKGGPVMKQYRGHPCPRIYGLKADRTVAWIGMSPDEAGSVSDIGMEMAAKLGFQPEFPRPPPPGAAASPPGH